MTRLLSSHLVNIPRLISTWSFGLRGHAAAWPDLRDGGSSLDAVERACRIVEDDPDVDSVGYGGLPDATGDVTVDGCVMLAPDQCGCVCSVRRSRYAVSIARRVMERTDHVMLAGAGADAFAAEQGLERTELVAPSARERWEAWRRDPARTVDQSVDRGYDPPRPVDTGDGGRLFHPADEQRWAGHDTISVLALDARGTLAGACSTSGTPFKRPGRVGDSPIIGHGVYVDPRHGAAAATGTGELISGLCSSFLVVELMRAGAGPVDALVEAMLRYRDAFELRDDHQVALIAMRPDGTCGSAALRTGFKASITDPERNEVVAPDFVLLED
jgi:N4-(beta-N-acetylglucosaminyl)-L-asparaginase